ncbi:hypothetical protein ACFLQN_03800 [Candidatus Aenigmatarchaeota archaeon]
MSNKKGILFTWDVILSIVVAFIIVFVAFQLSSDDVDNFAGMVSARRVASDVVASLDYNETFDTLDKDIIENAVNSTIPQNIDISMKIYVYDHLMNLDQTIDIRDDIENNYRKGKWSFATFENANIKNIVLVEYKVGFR